MNANIEKIKNKKKRKKKSLIIISLLLILGFLGAIIYLSFNLKDGYELVSFENTFLGVASQGFEKQGNVQRKIPQTTSNEGLNSRYPTYGTSLENITDEEKDNLLSESNLLMASTNTYDSMDSDGNLYLNQTKTGRKLYKHTSSVGMYYGDVSDNESAVSKKITIIPSEVRNYITGLYAPAGEVIKVDITSKDLENAGGEIKIIIGQVSHRNNLNNIWKARNDFSRMPNVANIMTMTTTTCYVGSFLGGPIYVYPKNFDKQFEITISGAVEYPHYIHGITTKEEFESMKNLSAPYFDFEVWDLGVRHSGAKKFANFDFDNLVKVGDLWEKICRTSRQVPCSANATIGVGFVYDCFVAAGEACAFQGGHSWVNAPSRWLTAALDYKAMTSTGFWGTIHEFNHLYQSYGMYGSKTNEVTNNATSLLSYVLYTNISANRSENDSGLTGWNRFTDPSRSLRETISLQESGNAQLSLNAYADIIHAFGTDIFTAATQIQTKLGVDYWYEALSKATGYNMTYYFENLLNQTLSDSVKEEYNDPEKPMFVPIACVYQTGRSVFVNNKEVFTETVKPFEIEKGEDFVLDFSSRLILPKGFTAKIVAITKPKSGTLTKTNENVYVYSPGSQEYSGTFKVTFRLNHESITTKDVTLTINLKQKITNLLNVTRYSYNSRVYNTVQEALENNFEGYVEKVESKSNTTFLNKIANNHIGIVEGKVYIEESGEYAFCLRSGRGNNTLYLSVNDKENLSQVLSLNSDHGGFSVTGEHVVKLNLNAGDYVYFKEITLSKHVYNDAFTELGIANLTKNETMKTIPSSILYNKNVEKTEYTFKSEEKYKKNFATSLTLSKADLTKQKIVSVNHGCWGESKIENILDGNLDTFYHNNQNNFVSKENPFILEVSLGESVKCNRILITSRKSSQYNLPCTFDLYGGKTKDDMALIKHFEDLPLINNTVNAKFEETEIEFYKIVVTDTKSQNGGNKYVTIAQIDLFYDFSGTLKSPFELNYYKKDNQNFEKVVTASTFGKVVKGSGKITYSFLGTGIALFARQNEDCKIKIYVDGTLKEVEIKSNIEKQCFYVSSLKDGKHNLRIEVLEGNLEIDSLIVR